MAKSPNLPLYDKLVKEGKLKLPTNIENEARIGQYIMDDQGNYSIHWRMFNVEPTLYRFKYIGYGLFANTYGVEHDQYVAFDLYECTRTGHREADRTTLFCYTPDPYEYIFSVEEFQALLRGDIDVPYYTKAKPTRQRQT